MSENEKNPVPAPEVSGEEKQVQAPESSDAPKVDYAAKIAEQQKKIAALEKAAGEEPDDSASLVLNRERDLLRHYLLVQKGNPADRARAKVDYAVKAALRRAIEPVVEE